MLFRLTETEHYSRIKIKREKSRSVLCLAVNITQLVKTGN